MNRLLPLLFLSIFVISCKNSEKAETKNEVEQKETESTELELDNDFKIIEFSEDSGFFEYLDDIEGEGPSLVLSFSIKNNTPHKITRFDFNRFAKATFSDGEIEYFPRDIIDSNKDNDLERFNHPLSNVTILEKGEIWKPNEVLEIELVIYRSGGIGDMFNFSNKQFQRTPKQFYFTYKYYAVSVDKEYEKHQVFDMLPFWKKYQEELGLR